jgi:DNA-binding response OmpR family regulator
VRPADTGEVALESVEEKAPDLILLDIRLPGLGGFEVCQRLKAHPETRDIPLMFISTSHEVEGRVEGLQLGAVDFISEPFRSAELLARVRTHLELGRLRIQLEKRAAERAEELLAATVNCDSSLPNIGSPSRPCVKQKSAFEIWPTRHLC